mmetsp:Transcript_86145/g.238756  ORF Transcript_86145/g.238756 Transcript_86145/m.238756 type:complete len:270 (-) Transcript_86145:1429-2238(-)
MPLLLYHHIRHRCRLGPQAWQMPVPSVRPVWAAWGPLRTVSSHPCSHPTRRGPYGWTPARRPATSGSMGRAPRRRRLHRWTKMRWVRAHSSRRSRHSCMHSSSRRSRRRNSRRNNLEACRCTIIHRPARNGWTPRAGPRPNQCSKTWSSSGLTARLMGARKRTSSTTCSRRPRPTSRAWTPRPTACRRGLWMPSATRVLALALTRSSTHSAETSKQPSMPKRGSTKHWGWRTSPAFAWDHRVPTACNTDRRPMRHPTWACKTPPPTSRL